MSICGASGGREGAKWRVASEQSQATRLTFALLPPDCKHEWFELKMVTTSGSLGPWVGIRECYDGMCARLVLSN